VCNKLFTQYMSRDREGAGDKINCPLPHGRGSYTVHLAPAFAGVTPAESQRFPTYEMCGKNYIKKKLDRPVKPDDDPGGVLVRHVS